MNTYVYLFLFLFWVFLGQIQVAIFLIQRNRHALIGSAIDDQDMQKILEFLKNDPVCPSAAISTN